MDYVLEHTVSILYDRPKQVYCISFSTVSLAMYRGCGNKLFHGYNWIYFSQEYIYICCMHHSGTKETCLPEFLEILEHHLKNKMVVNSRS